MTGPEGRHQNRFIALIKRDTRTECQNRPEVPSRTPVNFGGEAAAFSPGDLHQGDGHGGGVDGQVSVQVHDDADVEHVDSDWKTK